MDEDAMVSRMIGAAMVSVVVGLVFAVVLFVDTGHVDWQLVGVGMFVFFLPWAGYIYVVESGMLGP